MPDNVIVQMAKTLKAVILLGGDIIVAESLEHLGGLGVRSRRWTEGDFHGACPSYERVLAAFELWRMNPALIIIASGGKSNVLAGVDITSAQVISAELEMLGVPAGNIIEEDVSFTSLEQLPLCAKIIRDRGWTCNDVAFLSMGWHLPRVRMSALYFEGEDIRPLGDDRMAYISADYVLCTVVPEKWVPYFEELDATPEMQQRRVGELRGIEQMLCGWNVKYKGPFRGLPHPLVLRLE